ncbi:hypothetical protein [Tessaracoccus palaemonis]|uniref:Uncharacterized protein n=1 Tax=Tessaracoccus palaemonis TaxID=2829499 RepID=A0ABX8SN13_9ACTN|nr:hypothetical protein [Tessaracoccus palaemonis]QXT63782.1 hypothetical protein KDB89_04735 [Tessaracoccus palaemonis]
MTLRVWRKDPATPLDDLPELRDDSLPPEAFARLFTHLREALEESTRRWNGELAGAMHGLRSDHDFAERLIKLRVGLARRLQLVSHPSLPEPVRSALTEDFHRMVQRLQQDFERNVAADLDRDRVPRSQKERMMRIIRDNSFEGARRLTVTQDGQRAERAPLPEPLEDQDSRPMSVTPRRTVHLD